MKRHLNPLIITAGNFVMIWLVTFYEYVGLIVGGGGSNVVALYASMNTANQDSQKGAIAFYHFPHRPQHYMASQCG